MKYAYVDTSVIARIVLNETQKIEGLDHSYNLACNELVYVELNRTIDRCRIITKISDNELIEIGAKMDSIMRSFTVLRISGPVLFRAGQPLPVVLGTLDAIHLCSALLWQEYLLEHVIMITHDIQLAKASRMMGLSVLGC